MSHTQEAWDEDIDWLLDQCAMNGKRPTEAQQEAFAERVAISVIDGGLNLQEERSRALRGIFGG